MASPGTRRWMIRIAMLAFGLDIAFIIVASLLVNVGIQIPITVTIGVSFILIAGGWVLLRRQRYMEDRADTAARKQR